jgi:hypothetical protein
MEGTLAERGRGARWGRVGARHAHGELLIAGIRPVNGPLGWASPDGYKVVARIGLEFVVPRLLSDQFLDHTPYADI